MAEDNKSKGGKIILIIFLLICINEQNPMCNHEKVFKGNCTKSKFLDEIKDFPENTPPEVVKFSRSQINSSTISQC